MIALFHLKTSDYPKAKDLVEKDDITSRQSLTYREPSALGLKKEGYYLKINGSEESIKHAKEILKGLAEEIQGKEKDEVLKKIEEQEDQADSGFGLLFGG